MENNHRTARHKRQGKDKELLMVIERFFPGTVIIRLLQGENEIAVAACSSIVLHDQNLREEAISEMYYCATGERKRIIGIGEPSRPNSHE